MNIQVKDERVIIDDNCVFDNQNIQNIHGEEFETISDQILIYYDDDRRKIIKKQRFPKLVSIPYISNSETYITIDEKKYNVSIAEIIIQNRLIIYILNCKSIDRNY